MSDDNTKDWWPCACVKGGGRGKPSTHIKLHSPFSKKCRVCGCTRDESKAAGEPPPPVPR
jgi:hypothetical protein